MYLFVKGLVRLGLLFFCRRILFTDKELLSQKGPLLLACNHPNSFFDALVLGAHFKQPVHFLARGDAFKNQLVNRFLKALNAIPIYRLNEGREYLALNDLTFQKCIQILEDGGIVLIFSEGLCLNQWQLRPLKKGTARIALSAWNNDIIADLKVVPISFNYSSFTSFRKRLIVHSGDSIEKHDVDLEDKNEAEQINAFNKILEKRLAHGLLVDVNSSKVIEFLINNVRFFNSNAINPIRHLKQLQKKLAASNFIEVIKNLKGAKTTSFQLSNLLVNFAVVIVLLVPAVIALIIHLPYYAIVKRFVQSKTAGTVFYHSALFGVLIVTYPLYIFAITIIATLILKQLSGMFLIIVIPVVAMLYLYWRDALERAINYFCVSSTDRKQIIQVARSIT